MIEAGEQFGKLKVMEPVTLYRCGCMRCGTDSVLASHAALTSGRVRMCLDCTLLERMTPRQRAVAAYQKHLDLTLDALPIAWERAA